MIGGGYPEREEPRDGTLQRLYATLEYYAGRLPRIRRPLARIVEATPPRPSLPLTELRLRLRRDGFTEALVGEAFSHIRSSAERVLGMRHFDVQLVGGWAMLNGMLAEMETGEGKTLTATLAAATAALAGRAVHVITVNDYLASRDAEAMRPVYEALGLTVGCVVHGLEAQERRRRYACDIAYCSNKELTFDYLRDRITLGGKPRPLADRIDALAGGRRRESLLLRGLQFALVDEADSVLIDEARTPLILSAQAQRSGEEALYRQALELARGLAAGDYRVEDGRVELTPAGEDALAEAAQALGGLWNGPRRRERLVMQALSALHLFELDKQYLVRDGKVQIIDENTGRLMPDRSWEQGLHQLIELKEGVEVTGQRETLARISYQRFFRRYRHLAGMTGTATEVARELWSVYRLRVARIPTNRPVRRGIEPDRVYASVDEKWDAVVEAIRRSHLAGRPVLVGTRSVAASEQLARLLETARLPHQLLNARQDADEAAIVARAGERGRITVATNMAGRGTDIKLAPGVAEIGGLHVICTERHDSGRIDRQLFGRCGRQGDPGSCETFVSVADELVATHLKGAGRLTPPQWAGRALIALAQWRAERAHSQMRRALLEMEDQLGDQLAFSGRGE